MCLAVPGRIVEGIAGDPPFTTGVVEFAGVRRHVCLACVPEASVGDYVMVHAGVAISIVNAAEAARVLAAVDELELVSEFAEKAQGEAGPESR